MIRSFEDKAIPKVILDRILKNAFKGPSAGFSQGYEILVLTEKEDKIKFYEMWGNIQERSESNKKWMKMENAGVVLIVCSHKQAYLDRYAAPDKGWTDKDEARWPVPFWHIDAGMASLLALLTVVDEELGAVFTGVFDKDYARDKFSIPEQYTPMGAILIGYPASFDEPSPSLKRGHRDLSDVVHYNSW